MNSILTALLADTWGMHGSDVGWGWMMIPMVLFWGAVILGIVWLVRGGLGDRRGERTETPSAILERRFAEGAISAEEYRERRQVLIGGAPTREGPRRRQQEAPAQKRNEGGP